MLDLFKKSSAFSGVNKSYLGQLASSLQCDNTFNNASIWLDSIHRYMNT